MKSNGQHQKEATTTDQRNRHMDEHIIEREKQKLHRDDADARHQALEAHPKDAEQE